MFSFLYFFFFNATATTEIYTLSLHDALPISVRLARVRSRTGYLQLESECSKRRSHSGRTGSDRGLVCYANQPGPSKVLDKTYKTYIDPSWPTQNSVAYNFYQDAGHLGSAAFVRLGAKLYLDI